MQKLRAIIHEKIINAIDDAQKGARVRLLVPEEAAVKWEALAKEAIVKALKNDFQLNRVRILLTSAEKVANSYRGTPMCTVMDSSLAAFPSIEREKQRSQHLTRQGARIPKATSEEKYKAKLAELRIHAGDIVLAE